MIYVKKWACPPCRGYCNCSICRRKNGRNPTGQLAPIASAQGFKSVRHMLNNLEGEDSDNNISSDPEIEDEEDEKEDICKGNSDKENEQDFSKGNNEKESDFIIKNRDIVTYEESEIINSTENSNKETVDINTENEKSLKKNDVIQNKLKSCDILVDEQQNAENNEKADDEAILNKLYKDLFLTTSRIV